MDLQPMKVDELRRLMSAETTDADRIAEEQRDLAAARMRGYLDAVDALDRDDDYRRRLQRAFLEGLGRS